MTTPHVPRSVGTGQLLDAKRRLRRDVLLARGTLSEAASDEAARQLTERLLTVPEVADARTVAAYVSVGTEPATVTLLIRLHAADVRVLLPVLLPDGDLEWAPYAGPDSLRPAGRGLLEPTTTPLGVEAVRTADVVLVPGVAASATGHRLGRGGGSYDRALARLAPDTFTCVLLLDGELDRDVPVEDHDVPVAAAVTPTRFVRFRQ